MREWNSRKSIMAKEEEIENKIGWVTKRSRIDNG